MPGEATVWVVAQHEGRMLRRNKNVTSTYTKAVDDDAHVCRGGAQHMCVFPSHGKRH